jgi:quinol monooxygenase YgiN
MHPNFRKSILCLATIAAVVVPTLAQQPQVIIRSITRERVMPGRAGDFRAAVKEYNEVLRKAGCNRSLTVWLSASGPNNYAVATFASKYADFDNPWSNDPKLKDHASQLTSIAARINSCVESSDRIIEEVQRDLIIPGTGENPTLLRVVRYVVKPDRVDDFLALVKGELFPAAQRSGLKVYQVSRTRYGGPSTEFRTMAGWDKWADLDGLRAIQKAMGQEKYEQYMRKVTPMVVESQSDIYRYQPDLSYIPAPAANR